MEKCKQSFCGKMLVTCGNCNGNGIDKNKKKCTLCGGSGKLCPKHGADHGN